MICGHRQHSISREIGDRHAGYCLATWWPMPSSVFLEAPTRVEGEEQGISFGRRSNCDWRGRLAGREQQQTRRRDQLVLGSRAYGTVLKCGHFCPSGEWAKVQPATSRLAKYRRLGGSELQKCTVNRKGISLTCHQKPMNRIILPQRRRAA